MGDVEVNNGNVAPDAADTAADLQSLEELSTRSLESRLMKIRQEHSECMLHSSWKFTLLGVAVSVPLSVSLKTFAPFVTMGIVSTGVDFFLGLQDCSHLQQRMRKYQYEIASRKAAMKPTVE